MSDVMFNGTPLSDLDGQYPQETPKPVRDKRGQRRRTNRRPYAVVRKGEECILRSYRVILGEGLEVFSSLRYLPKDAEKIDALGAKAKAEAVRLANKKAGRAGGRELPASEISLIRERLVIAQ